METEIGKLVGKGAEAELYACKWLGADAVVKRRVKKAYRLPELDRRLRSERTKREAKALCSAASAGSRVPLVMHVDVDRNEIILSFVEGNLVRSVYDKLSKARKKAVVSGVGRQLALMHNNGIVHGDSTTSNVIYDGRGVIFIDFGLSEFTSAIEEQATDLLLFKKSIPEEDFRYFLESYRSTSARPKAIFGRLAEIEKRGRYVVKALAKNEENEQNEE
jgi:N6-L-threonylcarbamoyladenine synthase/protein kinase Bud32